MTATSAAIVELETLGARIAGRISSQIAWLRHLERLIEHTDLLESDFANRSVVVAPPIGRLSPGSGAGTQAAPPVSPVRARPPLRAQPRRRSGATAKTVASQKPKPTATRPTTRADAAPCAVREAIVAFLAGKPPQSGTAIFAGVLGSSPYRLQQLVRTTRVLATGNTSQRRYQLAPRFTGSAPVPIVTKPGGPQVEVVWSGTKERNGETRSLLGDRTRKPS